MRLKITDADAASIALVLLDNKVVPYPLEFDTEEGWVEAMTPRLKEEPKKIDSEDSDLYSNLPGYDTDEDPMADENAPKFDWEVVRIEGPVKVIFKQEEEESPPS